jgi:hypothetical protein
MLVIEGEKQHKQANFPENRELSGIYLGNKNFTAKLYSGGAEN